MKLNKCVRLFTEKHLENIGSMFKTLYNDELLTDCTLHCKDGSLRAHKAILAASSPYFRKVFLEHKDEQRAVFIMHGISLGQLKGLLELMYKGVIDVPSDTLNSVYELAEELELTGVLLDDGTSDTKSNGHGRDTRYKGQKRVAVDFSTEDNEVVPEKIIKNSTERRISSCSDKGAATVKKTEIPPNESDEKHTTAESEQPKNIVERNEVTTKERFMGHPVDEQSHLSVWARKERKFKCDLCPSSFKRASHLTRHQLVHTGERPFACSHCDKAFSRHDKLKHHVHKAHELPALNESADSLYTIGHVRILTPEQTLIESAEPVAVAQNPPRSSAPLRSTQKKGRGRPRKYPPAPPRLVKRPRGRPRLNPVVPQEPATQENYDISNMPYGDLEYLTKPLDENSEEISMHDHVLMEPLVEIKTDSNEKPQPEKVEKPGTTFLENIGLFENSAVAKIGECTISVANNNSATT